MTNILRAIYQPFWFSLLATILILFLYLFAKECGWKEVVRRWLRSFKTSSRFRKLFCLVFFIMLMMMRTLFNRDMWLNPLSDIMGGWTFYDEDGEFTTEAIENVMLMLPYTTLLLWALKEKVLNKVTAMGVFWQGIKVAFLTSIFIEFLQLILRLGTFQLSDIFYNTFGGLLGGGTYYICYKVKHRNTKFMMEKMHMRENIMNITKPTTLLIMAAG